MRNIYTTGKWFLCVLLFLCCLPDLSLAEPLQDISLSGRYAISGAMGRDQQQYHIRPGQNSGFLENSTQDFTALLSDSGLLEIKHLEHHIRMRLDGVDIENVTGNVTSVDVSSSVNRITYDYGMLKQWFVNGPMGLQQGFTISRRPDQQPAGRFVLSLEVGGDLRPTLTANGTGVDFLSQAGSKILTYSGLLVVDADGKQLPARFETGPAEIRIIVDDGNARYPVVVDPVFQSARLTADDGAAGDVFGKSVAVDGDIIVVGAPEHDIGSNLRQGAVYVFKKNGNWQQVTQIARLTVNNGQYGDRLGYSVAIDNDVIVAGAIGVAGGGAAYIFVRPPSGWHDITQTAELTASDGANYSKFGCSVAIEEDTVVIGASAADLSMGAVYVFKKSAAGWNDVIQIAKLTKESPQDSDSFGNSVAIYKKTIVVGNMTARIAGEDMRGAVYVFVKPATGWKNMTSNTELTASDGMGYDSFGKSVSVNQDTIVVGASIYNTGGLYYVGAVYVFERPATGWKAMTQTAKLTAADGMESDYFGSSVAIENNTIVVGSPYHNYSGTSSNGLPFLVANMGAVYTFQKPAGGWQDMRTKAKFLSNDGHADDHLGWSVALSGATIVAGAPEHAVNNNQGQGAAYVFRYKKKSPWPMFISAATSFIGYVTSMYDKTNFPKCDITNSAKITTHRVFAIPFTESITNKVIPHFSANGFSMCYTAMPVIDDSSQLICWHSDPIEYDAVEDDGSTKIRRKGHIDINPTGTCNKRSRSCTVYPNEQGSETIWQWYKQGNTWKLVPGMPINMPIDWSGNPVYFRNIDFINGGGSSRVDVSTARGEVEYTLHALHWGSRSKSICSGQ